MNLIPYNQEWSVQLGKYIQSAIPAFYRWIGKLGTTEENFSIFLVTDKQKENIKGVMTYFRGFYAELRGTKSAIKLLIDKLPNKIQILNIEKSHQHILENKRKIQKARMDVLLWMEKENRLQEIAYKPSELKEKNKQEICELLIRADPQEWGSLETKDIPMPEDWKWFGIWKEERLINVGAVSLNKFRGTITYLATVPKERRKSYALSMIYYLLSIIFSSAKLALINTRKANKSALKLDKKKRDLRFIGSMAIL
jgi:hypothetical protein